VLIATVIPVVTFLAGLKRIGPTDASMLSTLEPVVTVLLAALLFQEKLQPITLLGGGLILAAVIMLTRSELRQTELWRQRHEYIDSPKAGRVTIRRNPRCGRVHNHRRLTLAASPFPGAGCRIAGTVVTGLYPS
jgi:drug/metabolite transporter (DMT)-like permease